MEINRQWGDLCTTIQTKSAMTDLRMKITYDEQSNDDWDDRQPGSSRHDVDERDDVFSAYLDAR